MADADVARQRIRVLREAGLTLTQMAELCGVNVKILEYALGGRSKRLPQRIRQSTVDALNAISYRDLAIVPQRPGRKVDGRIPRLQLQALHSLGWSLKDVEAVITTRAGSMSRILRGFGTTHEVRQRIDEAYHLLRHQAPPTATVAQRKSVARVKLLAKAEGWYAFMVEEVQHDETAPSD